MLKMNYVEEKKIKKLSRKEQEALIMCYYEEPTKLDLKFGLEPKFKLTLDKRSHLQYFWDNATDSSALLALIFKKTLVNPYYISAFVFFNRILLDITLNAIFFNDNQIEAGHENAEDEV